MLPRFPALANTGPLVWLTPPLAPADAARLAVWSFLFGFAERIVPDVLDKLSGRLNVTPASKTAKSARPAEPT
jgi:hypothetical protein